MTNHPYASFLLSFFRLAHLCACIRCNGANTDRQTGRHTGTRASGSLYIGFTKGALKGWCTPSPTANRSATFPFLSFCFVSFRFVNCSFEQLVVSTLFFRLFFFLLFIFGWNLTLHLTCSLKIFGGERRNEKLILFVYIFHVCP